MFYCKRSSTLHLTCPLGWNPQERDRDAWKKIRMKPLKKTNLGMAFRPYKFLLLKETKLGIAEANLTPEGEESGCYSAYILPIKEKNLGVTQAIFYP